ncbi:polypeptide N-acetylgalactosaminyltransferase 5 isoform X2 [Eurytemora carolleeae]|uniref:polypeptide N-acetylgalactosaminyltransferase 5 isoform X2 n=1 Tax=Eurytemora carolleeae TaxID=1294199 RepID=UPI000C769AC0|nr:polypeptide N-acetylgalactosaminyltransferase 5 isoform X2 [Eurytemora carolleeae]|eukprot:XP_023340384.1 polypeptide N-acetylgalactosaminyltransferase 5-like isoform X2 [Eurytemora affinis]
MRFLALYFLMEILVVYCEICTVDEDCKQENDRDKTPSENIWTPEHKSEEINVPLSEGFIDEEGLSKGGIDEENVSKGGINEEGVSKRGIDEEGLSTEDIDEEGVSEGGIDEEDEDMELEMKYIDLAEQYGFQSLIVDGKVKDKDALINALTDADYDELVSSNYPDTKSKKESPLYNLHLTLVYDKELSGVHKENLEEQEKALKLFEADQLLPGDLGTGVLLKEMNSDEKLKRDLMFIDHAFDEYISEIISLNRTLPDRRDPWCYRNEEYLNSLDKLKPTAIIICFCNEAWSTLIRSIFSVLNRSPEHLIDEIILVDDASTLEHLGTKLDEFIKDIPKIKIVRLSERQGLMRSRLAGVRASTADVLTFLDSHIEATEGWLEPLLLQVDKDPKTVASPVIEAIDEKTFQYKFVHHDLTGVFNWKMEFDWAHISEKINGSRTHPWSPYSTPVMAGGLFTINKNWFQRIGLYDEGMEIWGGENLELSFRQWMCGGRIEIVPCSRVGHVYRTYSPYPWRSDINVLVWNPIRVAEVWMDQYKYLYFDRLGNWDLPLNLRLGNFGDVSARKALR